MVHGILKIEKMLNAVKRYVKENWGSPFIVAFALMLPVAAFLLPTNFFLSAYSIAIYAFYALVVGVILQFVCFVNYKKSMMGKA